jgi:hypothetical protein
MDREVTIPPELTPRFPLRDLGQTLEKGAATTAIGAVRERGIRLVRYALRRPYVQPEGHSQPSHEQSGMGVRTAHTLAPIPRDT